MFRSNPPKVFSKKSAVKIRREPKENNRAEARYQKGGFATLLKSHPCMDVPQRIHRTPAKHLSVGEHPWETVPVCQKSFERLNYKKLLFTVFKRNLFTSKNK